MTPRKRKQSDYAICRALWEKYEGSDWLVSVGLGRSAGKQCIILGVTRERDIPDDVPETFAGREVRISEVGKVRPA
jgi:hypothetical protein